MSSARALVVLAGLALSAVARAQQEPPLLFTGISGRPSAGQVLVYDNSSTTDDLIHTPVVVQPKPGSDVSYVIIEIKGGLPIVLAVTPFQVVNPAQSAKGDLVGPDENDDFVVVSDNNFGSGPGSVIVLPGITGTWDGTNVTPLLGVPVPIDIGANIPNPTRVATLNADGVWPDDILVGNASGAHLFLNGPSGFTSQANADFPLNNLRDIAVGDLDLDGHADFALAAGAGGSGSVDLYRYEESTGFVSAGSLVGLPAVASVELVDLNGDQRDDLVVALHLVGGPPYQGKVRAYLNTGNPLQLYSGIAAEYTRFSSTGTLPTFGAAGDVDADGDLDMVFTQTDSIAYPAVNFAQFNPPLLLLHITNKLDETPALLDFAMRTTRFTGKAVDPILLENSMAGGIVTPLLPEHLLVSWSADKGAGATQADDVGVQTFGVAGDGAVDGTGTEEHFDVPKLETFATGQIPGDGATADVALDVSMNVGALDIVVPNLGPNSLTVALGDGAGGFADQSEVTGIATPPSGYIGGPRGVVLTDLTGDGFADAVVDSDFMHADDWDSVITLLHSDTTGLVKVEELALPYSGELAVADIDGDGHKDVIVTRRLGKDPPHDIEVHFGGPGGRLDPRRAPYAVGLGLTPAGLTGGLAVGDVDGDGDVDVVVSHARLILPAGPIETGVVTFVNDWNIRHVLRPVASAFSTGSFVPDVESLVLGNVNGTAARDVAVGLRDGTLWYATGTGAPATFSLQTIDAESAQTGGGNLVMADLNEDARMDIVSCKGWPAHQSVVQLLYASPANDFDVHELAGWNPEDYDGATRPIVGDFDGDHVPDVAIVHSIGEVTVLLLH